MQDGCPARFTDVTDSVPGISSMTTELSFSDQLCFCTARLECELKCGGTSTGTSFFLGFPCSEGKTIRLLVTNRHVVEQTSKGTFHLTRSGSDGGPSVGQTVPVVLNDFEDRWIRHPNPEVDLCVMLVAPLFEEARSKGLSIFHRQFDPNLVAKDDFLADLPILQEVFMATERPRAPRTPRPDNKESSCPSSSRITST